MPRRIVIAKDVDGWSKAPVEYRTEARPAATLPEGTCVQTCLTGRYAVIVSIDKGRRRSGRRGLACETVTLEFEDLGVKRIHPDVLVRPAEWWEGARG